MRLTDYQHECILSLVNFLNDNGATSGLEASIAEVADGIGWSIALVSSTIRRIKENPDLGVGISLRRGNHPLIILSLESSPIIGNMVVIDAKLTRSDRNETIMRMARSAAAHFMQYQNTGDKRTTAARRLYMECRSLRAALSGIQNGLNGSRREERINEFIDEVLGGFPGRH